MVSLPGSESSTAPQCFGMKSKLPGQIGKPLETWIRLLATSPFPSAPRPQCLCHLVHAPLSPLLDFGLQSVSVERSSCSPTHLTDSYTAEMPLPFKLFCRLA